MTEGDDAPVMDGECRIEANSPSGSQVVIEGLRVRLDLRLVPGSGVPAADGRTDAVLRVASARITTTPEVPAYLRGVVWATAAALTLALVVWLASTGPKPLADDAGVPAASAGAPPTAVVESAASLPVETSIPEERRVPEREMPAMAPILPPSPVPHAPLVAPLRKGPALPRRASNTRAETSPSRPEVPPPVAPKLASGGDMLDLFEDPK